MPGEMQPKPVVIIKGGSGGSSPQDFWFEELRTRCISESRIGTKPVGGGLRRGSEVAVGRGGGKKIFGLRRQRL